MKLRLVLAGVVAIACVAAVSWHGWSTRSVVPEKSDPTAAVPLSAPLAKRVLSPGESLRQTFRGAVDTSAAIAPASVPMATSAVDSARIAHVPTGRFKDQLARVSADARQKVLATLAANPGLVRDVDSLAIDDAGGLIYTCAVENPPTPPGLVFAQSTEQTPPASRTAEASANESAAAVPIGAAPKFHSRPGAAKVVYLDFNGHNVTGTAWNQSAGVIGRPAVTTYACLPYDTDGDAATFSDGEQAAIAAIWRRVMEDYSPFEVDVTTEEPLVWTNQTVRVLITSSKDANGVPNPSSTTAVGAAYYGFYGASNLGYYSPAFIYYDRIYYPASQVGDVVSHEVGHVLKLSHDGATGQAYYPGHVTDGIPWGAIMGASNNRTITQWSKGDYLDANNREDDLAVLAAQLSLRPDDVGDTVPTARAAGGGLNKLTATGLLGSAADVDVFSFVTGTGPVELAAVPMLDGNADLRLELLDAAGTVLAADNPPLATNPSLRRDLSAGTYFLRVSAVGAGAPLANPPSGYTVYGSIGQYALSGTIVTAAPVVIGPANSSAPVGHWLEMPIVVAGYAASYSASGLPAGLTLDVNTGLIRGRPEATGVYSLTLSATNSIGTGSVTRQLAVVAAAPAVPVQTSGLQVLLPGGGVELSVSGFSANGAITYQWMHDGRAVPGATGPTLLLADAGLATNGAYWVKLTNSVGATRSVPVVVRVVPVAAAVRAWGSGNGYGQATVPGGLGRVAQLAAGFGQSVVLRADGTVAQWGNAGIEQIPLSDAMAVAAGNGFVLVLRADGTVTAVAGFVTAPQLPPAGLKDVAAIAAGANHSLALKTDGTVVAWGASSYGATAVPPDLMDVVAIAAGTDLSAALRADGRVVVWGGSNASIYAAPAGLAGVKSLALREGRLLALKSGGTTYAWGSQSVAAPGLLPNAVAVAVGNFVSLALNADGTLVSWNISTGISGAPTPADLRRVWQVSVGNAHALAIEDGSGDVLPTIGQSPVGQVRPAGSEHTFTVTATGPGPLGYQWRKDGSPIAGATAASLVLTELRLAQAGSYDVVVSNHAGATTSAPAVLTVQSPPAITSGLSNRVTGTPGQPLTLSATVNSNYGPLTYRWKKNNRVLAGETAATLTLGNFTNATVGAYTLEVTDANGFATRMTTFVLPNYGPTQVRAINAASASIYPVRATLTDAIAVVAGNYQFYALRANGMVVSSSAGAPFAPPEDLTDAVALAAMNGGALALSSSGRVIGWGSGGAQLPVPGTLREVIAVASGGYFAMALDASGRVTTWGSTAYVNHVPPAGLDNVSAIASGYGHLVALKTDGTVVTWGSGEGAVSTPAGLNNVVAIAAGAAHTLALKADGTVVAWGFNSSGQTSVPAGLIDVVEISAAGALSRARKADGSVVFWGLNELDSDVRDLVQISMFSPYGLVVRSTQNDVGPVIQQAPANVVTRAGNRASFTVLATGSAPLAYQWRKNGQAVAVGGRAAELSLLNVQATDAATYDVVVSNHLGSVTSAAVTLTLEAGPDVTVVPPARQTGTIGAPLTLTAVATSPHGALAYRWKKNNRPIPGATAGSYTVANFTNADAGAYTLEITDAHGVVTRMTSFVLPDYGPSELQAFSVDPSLQPAPAGLNGIVQLAGKQRFAVAVRRDGQVKGWGSTSYGIDQIPTDLDEVVGVNVGYYHALALRADGTVRSWGRGISSLETTTLVPAGLRGAIAVVAGRSRSYALCDDGQIVFWNANDTELYPLRTRLEASAIIEAGQEELLVLKTDGELVLVNANGEVSATGPAGLQDVVALATGEQQYLALKADGTVVGWSTYNTGYGEATPPAGLAGVVAISAHGYRSLALKADGSLVRWGQPLYEPSVPANFGSIAAVRLLDSTTLVLRRAPGEAAPAITQQPAAPGLRAIGSRLTLSVVATGAGTLAYQWRRDGQPLVGATNATLSIAALQAGDAGSYEVVVSNHIGDVTSAEVALAVDAPAMIEVAPPRRVLVASGGQLTLSVGATSPHGPLTYRWKKDNRLLPGAMSAVYTRDFFTPADAGAYTVEVTDARGLATLATTFVLPDFGTTAVRAWGNNGSAQSTVPSLNVLDAVMVSGSYNHSAVLKADGRVVTWGYRSSPLTVYSPATPNDVVAVAAGDSSTVLLRSDGTVGLLDSQGVYQAVPGLSNIIAIAVESDRYATLDATGLVRVRNYYGTELVTDSARTDVCAVAMGYGHLVRLHRDGTVTASAFYAGDSAVTLAATVPAGLREAVAIEAGGSQSLALRADGSLVAWGSNQQSVAIGTGGARAVAAGGDFALAQLANGTLAAWGSNSYFQRDVPADLGVVHAFAAGGAHALAIVAAPVVAAPVITEQPRSLVRPPGGAVRFSVTAEGATPLGYQWFMNGAPITGATAATYGVKVLQAGDFGNYEVVVSNLGGSARSTVAILTQGSSTAPVVTTAPTARVFGVPGSPLTLSVAAESSVGALSYQWKKNNRPIPGATGASHTLSNFDNADAGAYTVEISDTQDNITRATSFVLPRYARTEIGGWGANYSGQLALTAPLFDAIKVAAGSNHSLALRADGSVVAWGSNNYGSTSVPAGLSGVVAIAAGAIHSLALKADGTVVTWGNYSHSPDQLAVPTGLSGVIAINTGADFSVALKSDGTVVAWGNSGYTQTAVPANLGDVTAVAAGAHHVLALRTDGSVVGWGTSNYSLNTAPANASSGIVAIGAGGDTAFAVKADGTVVGWGYSGYNQTSIPSGLSGVTAIDADSTHVLALSANGIVTAWGSNSSSQTAVPAGFTRALAIAAGSGHSLALRDASTDGAPTITASPQSVLTTVGQSATLTVSATGPGILLYQWRKDGAPIPAATAATLLIPALTAVDNGVYDVVVSNSAGSVTSAPAALAAYPAVTLGSAQSTRQLLAAGESLTLTATPSEGSGPFTYQWSFNNRAISGATSASYTIPATTPVAGGAYMLTVINAQGMVGQKTFFVLPAPGRTQVRAWGSNSSGQIVVPAGLNDAIAVSAGATHALALRANGTVVAWGNNGSRQTAVPADLDDAVAVAAGDGYSYALRADGSVCVWGGSYTGASTVPGNFIAITAGPGNGLLVLRNDGTVANWNGSTLQTAGTGLSGVTALARGQSHALALKADGTVASIYAPSTSLPASLVPLELAGVRAIFAGGAQSAALKADGQLAVWGDYASTVAVGALAFREIACGTNFSLALTTDGRVLSWGENVAGQRTIPGDLGRVHTFSAGGSFALVLRDATSDGAPSITTPPSSTSGPAGGRVSFSVVVAGTPPFAYQWRQNGQPITGANATTLTLQSLTAAHAGSYDVVVTSHVGSVTSAGATLAVVNPPAVTAASPTRNLVVPGTPLTLTVTAASEAGALTYQWKKDNRPIAGATASTFSLASFTAADAGAYTVEITDTRGFVTRQTSFVLPRYAATEVVAWSWGSNSTAQVIPVSLTNAVALSAYQNYSAALRAEGSVAVWGSTGSSIANVPASVTDAVAIATGANGMLALRATGEVVAWGSGSSEIAMPNGLKDVIAIAEGVSHSLALKSDGTVVAWGNNSYQQCAVPANLSDVVSIAAGQYASFAVRGDGTVVAWGDNSYSIMSEAVKQAGLASVRVGSACALGLSPAGALLGWGSNTNSQLSLPVGTGFVQARLGSYHALALRGDGTVITWGYDNNTGLMGVPAGLANVVAIEAGDRTSLVLRDASGDGLPAITQAPQSAVVALGGSHLLGVVAQSGMRLSYQWRKNAQPITGATGPTWTLTAITAESAGDYDVVVTNGLGAVTSAVATLTVEAPPVVAGAQAMRLIGTPGASLALEIAATSGNLPLTYQWKKNNRCIPGATGATYTIANFANADAGAYTVEVTDMHGLVTRATKFVLPNYANPQVRGWGNNADGQLNVPENIGNVVAVATGNFHSVALRKDGTVVAWGAANSDRLKVPVDLRDVVGIAAGNSHSLALRSDGTVVGWGWNSSGEITIPTNLSGVIAVYAGEGVSAALKSDGRVVVWGYNPTGSLAVPPDLKDVVALAVGTTHLLALKEDGTLATWGSATYNVTTLPGGLRDVVAIDAGTYMSAALKADGQVVRWGSVSQIVAVPPPVRTFLSGSSYILTLSASGTLLSQETVSPGVGLIPKDLGPVLEVAAGENFALALRDSVADLAPRISLQPVSVTRAFGADHAFRVEATGTGALAYQWYRDGAALPGARNATLTLKELTAADAGSYMVKVVNHVGQRTSAVAALALLAPPTVTVRPPARAVVAPGGALTLTVNATSAQGGLTYRWKKNNRLIVGATLASLSLTNFTRADAGAYTAEIRDALGLVTRVTTFVRCDEGTTQVVAWGSINDEQLNIPVALNDVVAVRGTSAFGVAVRANGLIAAWGTRAKGALRPPVGLDRVVDVAASSTFAAALRDDGSVVMWGNLNYSGLDKLPAGLKDIIAISAGESHLLALRSDGRVLAWGNESSGQIQLPIDPAETSAISASWGGSAIVQADGRVLTFGRDVVLPVAGVGEVIEVALGRYHALALRADGTLVTWGSDSYGAATLPSGVTSGVAIAANENFSMVAKIDGTVAAWGYSSDARTAVPVGLANVFAVAAGGNFGLAVRSAASDSAPAITSQPLARNVALDDSATFTVVATGTPPLVYQWRKNGVPLSAGGTAATLILGNVQAGDAGAYDVVVSSHRGSVTSVAVTLGVGLPPTITSGSPARLAVVPGGALNLSVSAISGDLPLSYQWKRNNRPIPGATSAALQMANFTVAQAGAYTVEVADALGRVTRRTSFVQPQWGATQIVTWGQSGDSLLTVAAGLGVVTGLRVSDSTALALKADGTVAAWGSSSSIRSVPTALSQVADVALSTGHALALKADGTIVGWGNNSYGQSTSPANLRDVIAIAAGSGHSLALKSDGTVVGWGYNYYGSATPPAGLAGVVAIAASGDYSIATKLDGTVVAWGRSDYSMISAASSQIAVASVAPGSNATVAAKLDGTVSAWGSTNYGHSNVPAGLNGVTAVTTGYTHALALRSDGTVAAWGAGYSEAARMPAGLANVVGIGSGYAVALALRDASSDPAPSIGTSPVGRTVVAGAAVSFSVNSTGGGVLTYQWRRNGTPITGATSATLTLPAITAGDAGSYDVVVSNHVGTTYSVAAVLAVTAPPTVTVPAARRFTPALGGALTLSVGATGNGALAYQWSQNGRPIVGATGPTLQLANVSRASAGYYVCAVTDNNGTTRSSPQWVLFGPAVSQVVGWGSNASQQLAMPGDLTDVVALAAGGEHTLGLRRNGTLAQWGYSGYLPPVTSVVDGVVSIAAGSSHTLTLHDDGAVRSWGSQTFVPAGLTDVVQIVGGYSRSAVLKSDGKVVQWSGSTIQSMPDTVRDVVQIAGGQYHVVGLKLDGTVVAWGSASYGEATVPANLTAVTAVAAGASHSLALKSDGTVVAWGRNFEGQTNVPSGLSNVVAIAAGYYHSYALRADGTVVTWGRAASADSAAVAATVTRGWALPGGSTGHHSLVLRDASLDAVPMIVTPPQSAARAIGGDYVLTVAASGPGPLSYQWRRDGVAIAGATSAMLTLPYLQSSQAGRYDVTVSNHLGSVVSAPADVTVLSPPAIALNQPVRVIGTPGGTLNLSATITSDFAPLTYQWKKDNRPIAGETAATYALTDFTNAAAGAYTLVVTDRRGISGYATTFVLPSYGKMQLRFWGSDGYNRSASPLIGGAVSFATSNNNAAAVRADGTVAVWGYTGDNLNTGVPAGLVNAVQVVLGGSHALALRADGTVVAWGENGSGQTTVPARLNNVVAVAAGYAHSMALRADGTVVLWGANSSTLLAVPATLSGVVAIAAGSNNNAAALKADGTVVVWGNNNNGQTSVPAGLTAVRAIALGYSHVLALRTDGTVTGWGSNSSGETSIPAGLTNVVAIATDTGTSYALKSDSSIAVWGQAYYDRNPAPSGLGTVYAVMGAGNAAAALRDATNDTIPVITSQPASVQAVTGRTYTFTVTATGSGPLSYQWRRDGVPISYQTASQLALSYVSTSSAGTYDVVVSNHLGSVTSAGATLSFPSAPAVRADGALLRAGLNGQPLTLSLSVIGGDALAYQWKKNNRLIAGATAATYTIPSFSFADAGAYTLEVTDSANRVARETIFVLPTNAITEVRAWGSGAGMAVPVGLRDAVAISAGETHAAALRSDGRVELWGGNAYGQSTAPSSISDAVAVAAGGYHTLVLRSDGTVTAFGSNNASQAATWSEFGDVVALSAGYATSAMLRSDGTVAVKGTGFGYSSTTIANAVAVAAGGYHVLALKADGTVLAWGDNAYGQTNVPAGLGGVTAIAAGYHHSVALKADGSVVVWGRTQLGQTAIPDGLNTVSAISAQANYTLAQKTDGSLAAWGDVPSGVSAPPVGLGTLWATTAGAQQALALADISAISAPVITMPPQAARVALGAEHSLSVGAFGAGELTYQWRRDGVDVTNGVGVTGARAATLAFANFSAQHAGVYTVVVRNASGDTLSDAVELTLGRGAQSIAFAAMSDRAFGFGPVVLSAAASSELPVEFSVVAGPAAVTGNTLTLLGVGSVTVRATQTGDDNFLPAADVERSFQVLASFEAWAIDHFTADELSILALSGPNADADSDGFSNLMEYALGRDPRNTRNEGQPQLEVTPTEWIFTYMRPMRRDELGYSVEISSNLSSWTTANVVHERVSGNGDMEIWRARYPLSGGANLFFRLKVTH